MHDIVLGDSLQIQFLTMTAYEQIQQMLASQQEACASLEDVLITRQLQERSSRPPDYRAENSGLSALAQELASHPTNVLQRLCEIAVELCQANSAGVSIAEEIEGAKIFRWRAVAGELAPYLHSMLPYDFAPCGIVVQEDAPQLLSHPVRYYPYVEAVEPYIYEVLLIPFRVAGQPVGTVWIVSSQKDRHFDHEDERLLTNLSQFAAATLNLLESQEAVQSTNRKLAGEVEQHQAALKTLKLERERLSQVLLQTPAFITILRGPEHIFEYANTPYRRLVGHRDVIGKSVAEALPEITSQGFISLLDNVYQTGEPFIGREVRILLQESSGAPLQERYLDFVYQPLVEVDGSISGIFVHGVDLTDRMEALASVRKSEAHLRSILESSGDCIKVMDSTGHLLTMNPQGMRLMGIDDFSKIEGQSWASFWQGEAHERALKALAQVQAEGSAHFQGYCETALGDTKWWDVVLTAIPAAEGESALLLGVSRDLTELRATTQTLEAKNSEIETLNLRLQQSITETHHRVKNNLQLISALIDMQHGASGDMVPMSEFMRLGSSVRALGVIHDVLTQDSKRDSQETSLSVKAVLEKLLTLLQQTLGYEHQFRYSIEDIRLPSRKVTSLALVTNELFSNALKHGKGDVRIAFQVQDDTAWLTVSDDGPGFAAGFIASQHANTGLNLVETVVHHDLEGEVFYENRPEGGSQIRVRIPLNRIN